MNYYFIDKESTGAGTEVDPFNYRQFINYFDASDGIDCGVTPADGDILNIKGIINLIDRTTFLHINKTILGTITVKPWDWAKNGIWLIETRDLDTTELKLLANESDHYITELIIEGFAFLQNNSNADTEVKLTDFATSTADSTIKLKNYMIYCLDGNIDCRVNPNFISKSYGFNFYGKEVDFGHGGMGLYFYDGTIKADLLKDQSAP